MAVFNYLLRAEVANRHVKRVERGKLAVTKKHHAACAKLKGFNVFTWKESQPSESASIDRTFRCG